MPVAYEHEYYRDTKDGNRQRCRQVSYHKAWEDFAAVERGQVTVKDLTYITTRALTYVKTRAPSLHAAKPGVCLNCGGSGTIRTVDGGVGAAGVTLGSMLCPVCNPTDRDRGKNA